MLGRSAPVRPQPHAARPPGTEGDGIVRVMSARNSTDSPEAPSSDAGARGEERREQILEATARVISERGADGTRLADIARKAGVSIGLIQHYFNTRDELLAEAFDYFNEIWVTEWEQQADAESDPPHKLVTLLHLGAFEFEDWRQVQWRIWVEFWSLGDRDPKFRNQYERIYARFRSPFLQAIREGVANGQFKTASPEDAADRLTALIDGLRIHAMLEPHRMPRERMFELLVFSAQQELAFEIEALGR
jgi:AcrR family transcriptional regulator